MIKKIKTFLINEKKNRVLRSYCYRFMTVIFITLMFINLICGKEAGIENKQLVYDTCLYGTLIFTTLICSFFAEYDIMNDYINSKEYETEVLIPIECDPDEIWEDD